MQLIDRDASDKYKGFRFQKVRLAQKMLELLRNNPKVNIVAAPEYRDDIYLAGEDGIIILEQDKSYSTNFTFNSSETRVSIVNFLDNYFDLSKDPHVHFIFYTNVNYVKERSSTVLKDLQLDPLEKPVFEYLISKDLREEVISFVSKVIIFTYREEYGITDKVETQDKGFYKDIIQMKAKDWEHFLNQITFQFGEGDLEELTDNLTAEIKKSNRYSMDHVNKEEQIRRLLLDTIDERMAESLLTQKIINSDTIKSVYYEAAIQISNLQIDDMFYYWAEIHNSLGEDKKSRSLRQKIEAVCVNFHERTMNRYNKEATTVRYELKKYDNRQVAGLKFRVHESMERYFDEDYKMQEKFQYEELNGVIKDIKSRVVKEMKMLQQDYHYGITNDITIEKIVLLLIDECFYSFDEE